ncbi:MAG: type II secretion system protein GspD [Spartobacteria bacterium]|nr:type II secretion system protein GspD [Spartobacteria bacterium]
MMKTCRSRGMHWLWMVLVCTGFMSAMAEERAIQFNFDQVDVRVLAKIVGQETGRQFVIGEEVNGRVTVVTPPQLPVDEVYPLFIGVLESIGYTVVNDGSLTRIVKAPGGARDPLGTIVSQADAMPSGGLVTRIFKINHVSAVDLRTAMESLSGGDKKGRIAVVPSANYLIVTDTVDNIQRMTRLIDEIDRSGRANAVEVIRLHYADADDVARQLTLAFAGADTASRKLSDHIQQVANGKGSLPSGVTIVPVHHANSVLVVGTVMEIEQVKGIVAEIDQDYSGNNGPLHAVFLKYIDAGDTAKTLTALIDKKAAKEDSSSISIEADAANNALVVDASGRDFEWVRQLIDQLDQIPHQVMVEVLIAEVSLGKGLNLGVEWSTIDSPQDGDVTLLGRSRPGSSDTITDYLSKGLFPQGMTLGVAKGLYTDATGNQVPLMPFLVTALAEDDNVKILSNVPLWAQNNKEATVSVVKNVPMLKSTVDKGSGTASDTIQNIERKDVGIVLTLKPHVNPDREITLELHPSIEAIIDEGTPGTYTPTFTRREVSTTVTVADRSTVAITGLIREDAIESTTKVPLLGDIPWLGALFRKKSSSCERTNLMIFVTPHIVTDASAAESMRDAWAKKTTLDQAITNVTVYTKFE